MSLIDDLANNNYILKCPHCGKDVYKYTGIIPIDPTSPIMAQDFQPVDETLLPPKPGDGIFCPYCKLPMIVQRKETYERTNKSTN